MTSSPQPAAAASPLAQRLEALVGLVRKVSRARELVEIYDAALSALEGVVDVDRSAVLLLDPEGVARFVAWRGLSERYRSAVEGHFPWALDDPAPVALVVPNVAEDPSFANLRPVLEQENVRAIAFIPLVYHGRLVGKFMLYSREPRDFGEEELELANAVADLVAFAIERARLYAALEESDRRKDAFLATLAHELRNPLAPVAAALALVEQCPDDLSTYHRMYAVLGRSLRQIVKLVDELLDVSRITRGVITIEKQPVDLTSIIRHAIASVEGLIGAQRHELTLSLEPMWLEADPLRLEQVITNLVHNAAKYTPPGGHIRVSTRARANGVEIRVRDDGIGLKPAVIPRLFDLFVQVDRSLAKTRGGLGIGLTIVRELVHLHHGTVSAVSEGEGKGSEFTVWLPSRIEPRDKVPKPSRAQPRGPRRRVLVVDDNEDAANTLGALLEAWGHEVSIVGDGREAISAVAEKHPQIVLLDLGLPGMSGYDVAERLRASGERDLRIVAVSGYGQPGDIARSRAAGCVAHLAKPVDLRALERILAQGASSA